MRVGLEQLFFGRGSRGYAVLGATPGGETFGPDVESLCEAVGSPSCASAFQPFLVSRPCRGRVIMVKASRGVPDSSGRETVFFHALVGDANELAQAHVDAFALDGRGLFADKMPSRLERLEVSADGSLPNALAPRFMVDFPAVVLSKTPEGDLVRSLLGTASLGRAWATFAFRPLPGFDLYALDIRATRPRDAACYDVDGKLISGPSALTPGGRKEPNDERCDPKWKRTMLKISLVVNVVLIAVGAILLMSGSTFEAGAQRDGDLTRENEQLSAEVERLRAKCEKSVSREAILRELGETFERLGGTRQDELRPIVKDGILEGPTQAQCDKYNPYVKFVNGVILNASAAADK